jgi:hypothetical protein
VALNVRSELPSISAVTVAVVVTLLGCRQRSVERPPTVGAGSPLTTQLKTGPRSLSTGATIGILSLDSDTSTASITLEYETELALANRSALEREVETVWRDFLRAEADAAGARRAYVMPRERDDVRPDSSTTQREAGFVYSRGPQGSWSTVGGFAGTPPTQMER